MSATSEANEIPTPTCVGYDPSMYPYKPEKLPELYSACGRQDAAEVARLLAQPDIDVNEKSPGGEWTAFMAACYRRNSACIRLLLADARVKLSEPDNIGRLPLEQLMFNDDVTNIKWWIASGREMDLKSNRITGAKMKHDKMTQTVIAPLLDRFEADPDQVRREVRAEFGYTE